MGASTNHLIKDGRIYFTDLLRLNDMQCGKYSPWVKY